MKDASEYRIDEVSLDRITRGPLLGSRKVYVPGAVHPFLRVPMREIHQAPTVVHGAKKATTMGNPPLVVYDSSGPYTDPETPIDLRQGLAALREPWIRACGDVEEGIASGNSKQPTPGNIQVRLGALRLRDR